LRHQLLVLERSAPARLKFRKTDRLIFVWLCRLFPALLGAVLSAFVPLHRPHLGPSRSPFKRPPGCRARSPFYACSGSVVSNRERVGTCGTGSVESFGVRRALGNSASLIRCS